MQQLQGDPAAMSVSQEDSAKDGADDAKKESKKPID